MNDEMIITGYGSIRSPKRKANYVRFLLSKYSYEGISEIELNNYLLCIHDLMEIPEKQRGLSNILLGLLLTETYQVLRVNPGQPRSGNKWMMVHEAVSLMILPPFEYYGLKFSPHGEPFETIILSYKSVEKSHYPDLPYIGVGYKDKGKCTINGKSGVEADQTFYNQQSLKVISMNIVNYLEDSKQLYENLNCLIQRKVTL